MMKKNLLVLFTALLLSSCNLEITLPSSNGGSTSMPGGTTTSQGGNSSSQGGGNASTSQGNSSSQGGQVQTFTLEEPNFETRAISKIDDVTFDDFFNLGNRIDIKAYVSNKELNYLAEDRQTGYKNQTYHRCDKVVISLKNGSNTFTWEYEDVGIRQKGNTSRKEIFDGSGNLNLNHFKLAFDETFTDTEMYSQSYIDQYGNLEFDKREFLNTLSGLDIKWNKNEDRTNLKEIYSSYLYHAGGIMTSHIGLANFSIVEVDKNNKETSMGLCTVFEPSSKSMVKRAMQSEDKSYVNLPTWDEEKKGTFGVPDEKYGDYYECGWGTGEGGTSNGANLTTDSISGKRIGVGNLSGSYVPAYERKTNTSADYNDGLLRNMVSVINSGDYNAISEVVDLEEFAIKEGIEYYLGNPDGMRFNANNYKIYFRRTDGKAMFVPIDTDRCFGITKDWNIRNALKDESPWSTKDSSDKTYKNKIFSKTILSSGSNASKTKYQEVITAIRNSAWVENSTFNQFFSKAQNSYPERSLSLNDNNISFSSYIRDKNTAVDVAFNLSNNNNNSGGGSTSSIPSSIPNANGTRIYFENSLDWNDVYCYMYGTNISNGNYPGTPMNYYTTIDGTDIYYYDIVGNNYTHVIFNNGGSGEFNQSEKIETSVIGTSTIFKLGELSDRNRYYLTYETFQNK